jgi:GTPase-associated system helical domain
MSNMAVHMRITGLQVTNEDVDARKKATATLAVKWSKINKVDAIASRSADIAQALCVDEAVPDALALEIEAAIQEYASAFLAVERPLDIGICAGMAAMEILDASVGVDGWNIADVYGACLWSALSFQPAQADGKREALRTEVLGKAQTRTIAVAEVSRQRSQVNDFGDFLLVAGEEPKASANFKKATAATITALRKNAALDREELDFLWWSQLGRSRLLNRPLGKIREPIRLTALGIEAGGFLRRLPCDVHRDLVLRHVDADAEVDLVELMALVGEDRSALGGQFQTGSAVSHPRVFPLLYTLATGDTDIAGATIKRPASQWGARALLEAGLIQLIANGPAKL